MNLRFWILRFLLVFSVLYTVIAATWLARGRDLVRTAWEAAIWAALSAGLLVVSRIYHLRRGRRCAICRDEEGASSWTVF
jgi:hypothetical protein